MAALVACGGPLRRAPVEDRTHDTRPPAAARTIPPAGTGYYTVKRGDTLYAIAFQLGRDYREIAAWNGIGPPYTIYQGQRLRLSSAPTSAVVHPAPPRAAPARPAPDPHAGPVPAIDTPFAGAGPHWRWPLAGPIMQTYAPEHGKKGIDIGAAPGTAVHAASGGKVVYSGSGLLGYGPLIIIKHDERYLSAYGNNGRMLVGEGAWVGAGDVIAEVGTEAAGSRLHFEIRRNGTPIDPLGLLPRR